MGYILTPIHIVWNTLMFRYVAVQLLLQPKFHMHTIYGLTKTAVYGDPKYLNAEGVVMGGEKPSSVGPSRLSLVVGPYG